MAKKLTLEDKIAKIVDYCALEKECAFDDEKVAFKVELETTANETGVTNAYTNEIEDITSLIQSLESVARRAQDETKYVEEVWTVRAWVIVYKKDIPIDKFAVDDYEINFENGIEVQ